MSYPSSFSLLPLARTPHQSPECVKSWMSSSAPPKTVKPKKSRVGPPVVSDQLKAVKAKLQSDQQARTDALVSEYQEFGPDPVVDLYNVGRANVLNQEIEAATLEAPVIDLTEPHQSSATVAQPFREGDIAIIDLSESAGVWKGERRPFGLVLTRGPGELLVINDTTCNPGEYVVRYDAPFLDKTEGPE